MESPCPLAVAAILPTLFWEDVMRSRITVLLTVAATLCLGAGLAAAEPANLTPAERQFLESAGLLNAQTPATPIYFVAPGIKARETMVPLNVTSTTARGIRNSLLSSRPSRTNACATISGPLVNGGFEDGTFNGWTTSGAAGTGNPSLCGAAMAAEATITNPGLQPRANNDPLIDYVYQQSHAAMLGDETAWGFFPATEPQCSAVSQSVVIPAGTANFNFAYAVLASNPGHGVS